MYSIILSNISHKGKYFRNYIIFSEILQLIKITIENYGLELIIHFII